jgi:hypothetical protein
VNPIDSNSARPVRPSQSPERAPFSEDPVAFGDAGDARIKQSGVDASKLLRALLDEDESRRRSGTDQFDFQVVVGAERLRQLAGAGGRVSVILTVPNRARFDEISFAGQTQAECEHHGVHVKALFSPLWRILVLHPSKGEDEALRPL